MSIFTTGDYDDEPCSFVPYKNIEKLIKDTSESDNDINDDIKMVFVKDIICHDFSDNDDTIIDETISDGKPIKIYGNLELKYDSDDE